MIKLQIVGKAFFISIILSFSFLLSTTCCASAKSVKVVSIPGYCVLDVNQPLTSQINKENTTYEIRYAFDLKGANITIPKGSTLLFRGGILLNGSVNLNDCFIEGNANINCVITGCPSNEDIYTKWFTDSKTELFALLRNFCSCWYNDKVQITHHNNKRVIHVEKGEYNVTEGIELRYEEDLTIDFGGSTIIDNVDTYDKLRHCASPVIAMRESNRISIINCNYQMGNEKGKKNKGLAFIDIGGPTTNTVKPNYNIKINNISGETNSVNGADFIPISLLGNCYNIEIANITWKGVVSSLVNMESALGPMSGAKAQSTFGGASWPYPDNYGLMPYNITIHSVYGYDRPTAKYGYIRTGGAYNVTIQNVYCWNVMEVIELFQGDAGNARAAMNITVSNVCSYWGEEMKQPNYAVSVNITRRNPQSNEANPENADIAMIRFIDCDFQDNGKGDPNDHYLVRVHGNNGMTVFSNCRFYGSSRAVRIQDIINTSLLSHMTKFESCLFSGCRVGVESTNAIVSIKDCIFDTDKNQINQIKYKIAGVTKEILENSGAMLNVEGNMFRSKAAISSPYVSVSSELSLPQYKWFNVSQNIFNDTKKVPAIRAKNVPVNEEKNVGKLVIEKNK